MKKNFVMLALMLVTLTLSAQDKKIQATAWDGVAVAGYVDDGGFVNFGGPSIKWIQKPYSIGFGMLPSLRFKEDKTAAPGKKNATLTPSLGFGFNFSVKHFVLQVPLYYNPKTATADGVWNTGVGIGYKF
jgi:hypothetical protein